MYIFRYASQPPADKPVCIALQQAPLGKGSIDFFPAEGVSKNMLTKLGDTIVARVKAGVTTVLITEYHMFDDVIEPVDLRIDRIDTSPAIMRTYAVVAGAEPAAAIKNLPAPTPSSSSRTCNVRVKWFRAKAGSARQTATNSSKASPSTGQTSQLASTCCIPAWSPAPALAATCPPAPSSVCAVRACPDLRRLQPRWPAAQALRTHRPHRVRQRRAPAPGLQSDDAWPHRHRAVGGAAYRRYSRYEDERCPL